MVEGIACLPGFPGNPLGFGRQRGPRLETFDLAFSRKNPILWIVPVSAGLEETLPPLDGEGTKQVSQNVSRSKVKWRLPQLFAGNAS